MAQLTSQPHGSSFGTNQTGVEDRPWSLVQDEP